MKLQVALKIIPFGRSDKYFKVPDIEIPDDICEIPSMIRLRDEKGNYFYFKNVTK